MIRHTLGDQIDIHGGGADLISRTTRMRSRKPKRAPIASRS